MTSSTTLELSTTRQKLLKSKAEREKPLQANRTATHPKQKQAPIGAETPGTENGSVFFIGTATTLIEWDGIRLMTDPNFLHAGDHVHLGPGVTAQRRTNPAVELEDLPSLDGILLSHYHADHFDQKVEEALNKDFLIISTPHAKKCLTDKEDPFRNVHALDHWDHVTLEPQAQEVREDTRLPRIQVTGMPGKHVPPGPLSIANDLLGAVPPTNGWMIEMGYGKKGKTATTAGTAKDEPSHFNVGYRIYISGDTLFVDDLKKIPEWLGEKKIDLMIVHLGGTTIPGPSAPLIMVTMDAVQGLKLMHLVDPDVTVPVHFDDYDVFLSPLEDFKKEVQAAGKENSVVFLDRGEKYAFTVKD